MKVIFLDIDGVLNAHHNTVERWRGFIGIDPHHVALFNKLIEETGADVVLSSAWRSDSDWLETMKTNGIKCNFLGKTDHLRSGVRGFEIEKWLNEHPEVTKYAIIDDSSDMLAEQMPNFFHTIWDVGLTPAICEKIKNHFTPHSYV